MGVWAPIIPFVKQRLEVADWELGVLLLCIGLGSILTMPAASAIASRFGCRLPIGISGIAMALCLFALSITPGLVSTAGVLIVFGAAVGAADCVANIQAVIVERKSGRPMMSGFHGCFSAGGLLGAAGTAALLSVGVDSFSCCVAAAVIVFAAGLFSAAGSLPYGGDGGQALVLPPFAILLIGIIALVASLTEGAMLDWSAVFLFSTKAMQVENSGIGYVVFALVMTFGRLFGDRVVRALGPRNTLVLGAICAAAGLAMAVAAPTWHSAVLGFGAVGAGIANIFPVLVSSSARQKIVAESVAVPAVLTLGYVGILMGPAIIGFVAAYIQLTGAIILLSIVLLVVSMLGAKAAI